MPEPTTILIAGKTYVATTEPANVFSPAFRELARVQTCDGKKAILYQHSYTQQLAVAYAELQAFDPLFAVFLTLQTRH